MLFSITLGLLTQDGTIEHDVKLTGCLSTSPLSVDEHEGGQPTHGTLLAPGLNAQIHQHFFMARLDMAVDCPNGGEALTVSEVGIPKLAGYLSCEKVTTMYKARIV